MRYVAVTLSLFQVAIQIRGVASATTIGDAAIPGMLQAIADLYGIDVALVTLLYLQDVATGDIASLPLVGRRLAGAAGSLGWVAGFGVNATAAALTSPSAPTPEDMVRTAQACFSNSTTYSAVFGPVAASIARRFNVEPAYIFDLAAVQVRGFEGWFFLMTVCTILGIVKCMLCHLLGLKPISLSPLLNASLIVCSDAAYAKLHAVSV